MRETAYGLLWMTAACLPAAQDPAVTVRDLYEQGNYREALQRYDKALFEASNPALIWFNMANCWYQLDSLTNAAVCYEMALEEAPGFFRAALNLGILKFTLEDYPGVIALFESARFLEPENTQLLQILASAYLRLEATAKAIPLLEQALSIDAGSERCYFLLYDANHRLGNLYNAARWLSAWPGTGNDHLRRKHTLLAELAQERGMQQEALSHWRRVIETEGADRWAFYRYIALLAQRETALLALEEADGTLIRFPDFGELSLLAGTIATEQGLYDQAARYFMHARDCGLADALVGLENLAVLLEEQGRETAALLLRKAIVRGNDVSVNP
jgi:tetratricopeptide (TPR) repeat protein